MQVHRSSWSAPAHLLLLCHQLRNAGLCAVCHGGSQLLKHISHLCTQSRPPASVSTWWQHGHCTLTCLGPSLAQQPGPVGSCCQAVPPVMGGRPSGVASARPVAAHPPTCPVYWVTRVMSAFSSSSLSTCALKAVARPSAQVQGTTAQGRQASQGVDTVPVPLQHAVQHTAPVCYVVTGDAWKATRPLVECGGLAS